MDHIKVEGTVAQKPLEKGIMVGIVESRESAIPEEVPGKHYIVGLYKDGEPLNFSSVTDDQDVEAYRFAKRFAETMSNSGQFGHVGIYRIVQNSPAVAVRTNYHLHIIILGLSLQEIEEMGYKIRRLVDPQSFLVRV